MLKYQILIIIRTDMTQFCCY